MAAASTVPAMPVEGTVLLRLGVPARVRCLGASEPDGPPPFSWRTTPSNWPSNRPNAPPALEKRPAAVPSPSSSASSANTWLRCSPGRCRRVVGELSTRLVDASRCRARMVPKLCGGSAIAWRLSAAARDAAGESARAATSGSMSGRTDGGNRSSIVASARCPSTARYRLASAGRRVSLRTTSVSRLPAARSDACTATASTCSRVPMPASTKTTLPSVQVGSPGSPGATRSARLEIADANKDSRPGLSADDIDRSVKRISRFLRLCGDAEPVADADDFVEDRHRNGEWLCRRHVGDMSGDVVGGRVAAGLCEPTLADADEDPREAPGTGRVVVMAELAGPTGKEDDDRHNQVWLDGPQKTRLLEVLRVGHRVGDHACVAEGEYGVGQDSVLRAFDGDDVGQPE